MPEDLTRQPDEVPVPPNDPAVPKQEHGVRPARALPYELKSHGIVRESDGSFQIHFHNSGQAAAVFQVRSGNASHPPRTYTVDTHDQVADAWSIAAAGASDYDLSVYGPNGFFRGFKGALAGRGNLDVQERYNTKSQQIVLTMTNRGSQTVSVRILNRYTSRASSSCCVPARTRPRAGGSGDRAAGTTWRSLSRGTHTSSSVSRGTSKTARTASAIR